MSDIPIVVQERLELLSLDSAALQAPNFVPDDLVYHEPTHAPHEAATGVWSIDNNEFAFSLVGQVSAHHTFLGAYGDVLELCKSATEIPFSALLRAKWKVALVLPSTAGATVAANTLFRQGEMLRQIEANSCAVSPLKAGTVRGTSFVHRTRNGDRISVYSGNIYRIQDAPEDGQVDAASWPDPQQHFRNAIDNRKASTVVQPLDLHAADGSSLKIAAASDVFVPGSWVEVFCVLKMWDNSEVPVRHNRYGPRRPPVRSFQVVFDAAQFLCNGRLVEPPRTDIPRPRAIKRTFTAIATSSALSRPTKIVKVGGAEPAPADDPMLN